MKSILIAIMLFFVSSAASAEVVDIEFFDSGNDQYRTVTLSADLKLHYGNSFEGMRVLLIEVPSLNSKDYLAQDRALEDLGHETEDFRVLFVIACTQEEYKSGYHTTREVALKLAAGMTQFRARLLDSSGNVIRVEHRPLSGNELRQWLWKKSK